MSRYIQVIAVLAFGGFLAGTGLAQEAVKPGSAPQPAVIENVDWVRKPDSEAVGRSYPAEAMKKHMSGRARIRCIVTTVGALRNCTVLSEDPAGVGFGAAAVSISSQFLMKPPLKDGLPIEAVVIIPISYNCDGCQSLADGRPIIKVYSQVAWNGAPTVAQVMAAYPEEAKKAGVSGRVAMTCDFVAQGAIKYCAVDEEFPGKMGFGKAAKALAPLFRGPLVDGKGGKTDGGKVKLNVSFSAEMARTPEPKVDLRSWIKLPTMAQLQAALAAEPRVKGKGFGVADMLCQVVEGGLLSGCKVTNQTPDGFGDVGLVMAQSYVAAAWTEEGLPVIGGATNVHLQFGREPLDQASAKSLDSMVQAANDKNDLPRVRELAGELSERFPGTQEARNGQAYLTLLLERKGEYAEALKVMANIAATLPDNAGVYNRMCWLKATRRIELDTALANCDAAIAKDPKFMQALDSRGFLHLVRGEYAAAKADLDAALALRPDYPATLYVRGIARQKLGDKGGSTDIKAALKARPGLADEYKGYGVTP